MNQQRISALLDRLTISLRALTRRAAADAGLQPVHLQILGYLSRCNRFSNTPIAVSEYLGIQKGTISQSVALLANKGYLVKENDSGDRRLVRLILTPEGRRLAAEEDRAPAARMALESMQPTHAYALEQQLQTLVMHLNSGPGVRSFGSCQTCKYVTREADGYKCGSMGERLEVSSLTEVCREHRPRGYPAKARSMAQ